MIALYFNVLAGFLSIAIHGWLVIAYTSRKANRNIILLMHTLGIISTIFAIAYLFIALYPEWYLFIAQNVLRISIGISLVAMSVSSLLVYRYHQSDLEHVRERRRLAIKEAEHETAIQIAKNQIINNVGHEIKTPVTIIIGYVELLLAGEFGAYPIEMESPLNTINNNSKRINIIVRRMATLLRAYDPEPFDIHALVCNMTLDSEIWIATRREPGSVKINCVGERTIIEADKDKLFTAVFELVHNAIKFGASNVNVSIIEGEYIIKIIIQDDGIGIDGEHHEIIFEPFVQLHMHNARPFEGTGMGLAVVKHVANLHGGNVEVDSNSSGIAFTIIIPKGTAL